ncbi:hypothetical protein CASFOL_008892 [Castilleja foliolosa]|uniref:Uncharacterized protein n=1 Tax=Castilleja foliolosa TaxID=1961234 RepID=A0ABD3E1A3_9LAMI
MALPLMCCSADMLFVPSRKQVVLVGDKSSPLFHSMLASAHASYDPNKTVIHVDPDNVDEIGFWETNNEKIAVMAKNNSASDKVVALVCKNFTCSPPILDPESLESILAK